MENPTRIAIVNYAFGDDLADPEALIERYSTLTGWAEAIAASGTSVSVVQRFRRDARIARNSVEYVFGKDGDGGDPRSRLWPARLHRVVRELRPDLVHINGLNVPLQTWLLRRVLPSKAAIVMQDHGGGGPIGTRLPLAIRRAAMRAPDAFFFTATAQADAWRQAGLIAANQPVHQVLEASTTIRPVDRSAARQTTGLDGDPAVLWVGRLNANKDPLTILDGFERSLSRLPDATLTLLWGADDLLPAVQQRVQASPALVRRVRLVGSVPHGRMAAFYSAADVFVLGSHHEGSGYALIEACACGLPSAVTDIPTFRVITAGGSTGALWPTGDATALADALVGAAGRERKSLRERVREHFDRALSWTAVGSAARVAYASVLAARA